MPQVSGCVLALDTFPQDKSRKAERVSLWYIPESPEKAGRENKENELTVGVIIALAKISKRQVEISTVRKEALTR